MFGLRPALASVAVNAVAATVVITLSRAPVAATAAPLFTGDYSTGDFSRWPSVQNRGYNGDGGRYVPTYPATVMDDPAKGKAAGFEVRSGDVPEFGGGERSDVGSNVSDTGGTEEDPTKIHADLGSIAARPGQHYPKCVASMAWRVRQPAGSPRRSAAMPESTPHPKVRPRFLGLPRSNCRQ
jgi:hypothetical protein